MNISEASIRTANWGEDVGVWCSVCESFINDQTEYFITEGQIELTEVISLVDEHEHTVREHSAQDGK